MFMGKVLWMFDIGQSTGTVPDLEKDFVTYGFWVKPQLNVRFIRRQDQKVYKPSLQAA
jgi:hypothetical protein